MTAKAFVDQLCPGFVAIRPAADSQRGPPTAPVYRARTFLPMSTRPDQLGTTAAGLGAALFTALGADELDSAIQRAVVGGGVVHEWTLHAVTLSGEARVSDPMCGQVLHDRLGAALR